MKCLFRPFTLRKAGVSGRNIGEERQWAYRLGCIRPHGFSISDVPEHSGGVNISVGKSSRNSPF